MDYRNDLEASRLRINTLEAKLEESKASLEVREAELAECKTERDRLRQTTAGKASPSRGRLFGFVAIAFVTGTVMGVGSGYFLRAAPPPIVAVTPAETVTERGPKAEGRANVPRAEPRRPAATDEGRAAVPREEPREPAATVAGQTGDGTTPATVTPVVITGRTDLDSEDTKSIRSVIDTARPKIRDCYRADAKSRPEAAGSVRIVFDIDSAGRVARVELKPTLQLTEPWWSKGFESCVSDVYRKLEFQPSSSSRTTADANYFFSALDQRE